MCLQDTESEVSKTYVAALENVLDHGVSEVVQGRWSGYVLITTPRSSSYMSPRWMIKSFP